MYRLARIGISRVPGAPLQATEVGASTGTFREQAVSGEVIGVCACGVSVVYYASIHKRVLVHTELVEYAKLG